jgi:sugar phosphate permease
LGWRQTVYVAGLIGLPWSFFWFFSPLRQEPVVPAGGYLKDEESVTESKINHSRGIGLVKDILSTPTFYAITCANFAYSWLTYVVMAWLPMYMRQELGVSGESLALSCVPYVATAIASPFLGMLASWVATGKDTDLWKARRTIGIIATMVPALGMLLFPRVPDTLWPLPLVVIAVALAVSTLASVSVMATLLDITGPQTSGLLYSIQDYHRGVE